MKVGISVNNFCDPTRPILTFIVNHNDVRRFPTMNLLNLILVYHSFLVAATDDKTDWIMVYLLPKLEFLAIAPLFLASANFLAYKCNQVNLRHFCITAAIIFGRDSHRILSNIRNYAALNPWRLK